MNKPAEEPKPSILNLLLRTCVDGEEGYQLASDSVKDAKLKETLATYSAQRTRFRQELRVILDALAENPDEEPTMTGSVHHGWINLKAIAKDGDSKAILVECVRGENAAIERYGKGMILGEIPDSAVSTVRRQAMEISDACNRMEELARRSE
jgi:uncharacterized protein (TIGR02284 family)